VKIPQSSVIVTVIMMLTASSLLAQDRPSALDRRGNQSFESLMKEYRNACQAWEAEYRAASDEARKSGNEQDIKFNKPFTSVVFAPRFLAIAESDPEGPEALDAVTMAFQMTQNATDSASLRTRQQCVDMLRNCYITKPAIKDFLGVFSRWYDNDDSKALLAQVIAGNSDRRIQAAAYKARIDSRRNLLRFADQVKDPKHLAEWEDSLGKDAVKQRLVESEKAKTEVEEWRAKLRESYGDVFSDLTIGNQAPEIKISALDGTEATLSALKGKVVVLDIWTTWCGPCRQMIPHEREMVARLKDKPFALISISFDEKKETLRAFVAKENMPWTHWWNGEMDGGPMENWAVNQFPTIYVLDANGVIRHKDLRGDELEKAVNALLAESDKNPVKSAS
jgi:thiol-disulfide isomerase/thioredoxin